MSVSCRALSCSLGFLRKFNRLRYCIPICYAYRMYSSFLESLNYRELWFHGVEIDLNQISRNLLQPLEFRAALAAAIVEWKQQCKRTIWLKIPIQNSDLITVAGNHGFTFHHAKGNTAVMTKWLPDDIHSKIPEFGTHQIGVCGVVVNESKKQVLVVQEKVMKIRKWKFPGGHANHAEDFKDTAIREVLEETGVKTEYRSVLAFRHQHHLPHFFDQSDIYVICRLSPITYEVRMCNDELSHCEWLPLDEVAYSEDANPLTKFVAQHVLKGLQNGFDTVDITYDVMPSIYEGLTYKLYHR